MKPIRTFSVVPALPPPLEPLRDIAMNLRWAWDHDAVQLFQRLQPGGWEASGRNPVRLLSRLDQARLEEAASDRDLVEHVDRVAADLSAYLAPEETWYSRTHDDGEDALIAYFSAEFGVTGCLRIFSGGLGMLAGDHLKSASDLGVPLVAVGLLYQQGYFTQRLNEAGWQQEVPATNDFDLLPIALERTPAGEPVRVELGFPDGLLVAQVWRAQVGRVALYLLDANVPENTPEQRRITDQLYSGGEEMRIRQEILLGIGGYRALEALGHEPSVYHMNEGHSAFLALERIRRVMEEEGVSFEVAREAASAQLVFTTHTPVDAGHDYFSPDLLQRYFEVYTRALGIEFGLFLGLGRVDPGDPDELFCMTILALRLSARANAVSRLHGAVSRAMWQGLWPHVPETEVPIGHVTNGVHLQSWVSRETSELLDRYLGREWRDEPMRIDVWDRTEEVPAEEIWQTHERRRRELIEHVEQGLREQLRRRGEAAGELPAATGALDPNALTIGFARRFATYKRATLIARDRDRLARIFSDADRPVQLIVAGKAHPRDDAGKEFIRQVVELSREEPFRGRIVFVEDYGMALARYLVGGCDVWLNNPVRPREASGTSGMKAAANGALNLSTLDGWWDEAWNDHLNGGVPFGWAIASGVPHLEGESLDRFEAASLYDLLEHDVIPTFYDRDQDGVPRSWVARMRASVRELAPRYNTHRMLEDYTSSFYVPATREALALNVKGLKAASQAAAWRQRVTENWYGVAVSVDDLKVPDEVRIGDELEARASVWLGDIAPDDVAVELYLGPVGPDGWIEDGRVVAMEHAGVSSDVHVFEVTGVQPSRSGRYGYTVRVRPRLAGQPDRLVPGCMTWAAPLDDGS